MIRSWAVAFGWTLAIEVPIYATLLVRAGVATRDALRLGLALNLATHPLFSCWYLASGPGPGELVLAELMVTALEAGLLAGWLAGREAPVRVAILAAPAANAASVAAGLGLVGLGLL